MDTTEIPSLIAPVEKKRGKVIFEAKTRGPGAAGKPSFQMARIFIGGGTEAGLRPKDLVGAIVNEAGAPAAVLGAIHISARHSLIEVPAALATAVINALRATRIKGRKLVIRRDRDVAPERGVQQGQMHSN